MGKSVSKSITLDRDLYEEVKSYADKSFSAVVREALRDWMRLRRANEMARKLHAVGAAARHDFPTADLDEVLANPAEMDAAFERARRALAATRGFDAATETRASRDARTARDRRL